MSDNLIELVGVSKTYQKHQTKVTVLDDLNLSIRAGEFLAVMGPSGSGKTTMLNLIGGLDRPSAGSIKISGKDIAQLSSSKLARWRSTNIGFVFQCYNLLPALTALANVELPLLLRNLSAAQREHRARIALDIVGLADRHRHRPFELSGGQEQRVAIARAIVNDPTLLVCDEPTGDLDRSTADDVLDLLKTLNLEQGKTILMVTHDPRAADYANRCVVMDKGNFATDSNKLLESR